METNKEFSRERIVLAEGVQSTGEYVLPDYQGDVRKVLFSRATAVTSGKYHNGDVLESAGIVCYDIVYLDSEGNITPVTFTTDFELSVKCSEDSYIDAYVDTRVANFALRLMGPRKFVAKASLECKCRISESASYAVSGDAFDGTEMEARCETVNVAYGVYGTGEERELAEEVERLEGAIVDEVDVLLCTAEPRGVSITRTEEGAEVKCEIAVTLLMKCANDVPYSVEHVLDFNDTVMTDAIDEGMSLAGNVDIISVRPNINPEEDGVSVVVNLLAVCSVSASGNVPVRIVKDCYSTSQGTECQCGEFGYTEYIGSRNISEKFATELLRESIGAESVRNVFFSVATPKVESVDIVENMLKIGGSIRFSGIACEILEDGTPAYSPIKFDVPFVQDVNYDSPIPTSARSNVCVMASCVRIDLDQANVRPSCTLTTYSSLTVDKREPCVSTANLTDEHFERDMSLVSVYYPSSGESLFDVAKKFHTSPLSIAKDNELTESVFSAQGDPDGLKGIRCLIIK